MKKKSSALILAAVCMSIAACGSGNVSEGKWNVDGPNKVKIVTANFGGGIGNEWLVNAAERFAEKMADHIFPSGKKGVYIDTSFTDFSLGTGAGMESSARSVFFDERFSDVQKLAQAGYLLNLDEIVKDETRTGGSIETNLFSTIKDGLQVNNNYYGLPHYEYYGGLSYNREVFEEIGAFFVDESSPLYSACLYDGRTVTALSGSIAGSFYGDSDIVLSVGPDGKRGTIDDGLPKSIEEFVLLMDYVKFRKYAPIALSGQFNRYMDYLVSGLWASFAGAEQMRNYYNCSGTIEVIKRDSSGNILFEDEKLVSGISYIKKPKTEVITMKADGSEGYRGNDMAAKYYALAVCDIIYNEHFFTNNASVGTNTHYDAQGDLFLGRYLQGYEKAAMLIEGTYWYNETEEFAHNLTKFNLKSGRSASELDLRWMPLPTSVNDDDFGEGKEQCLLDIGHSYTMINKNVENNPDLKEACLAFVSFLYSEDELANFTIDTGMSRMIKYSVSESKMDNFEPFYRKLYEQRQANTDNVIGLSGTTKAFTLNKDALKIELQSQCLKEAAATPRTLYGILSGGTIHTADIHNMYLKTNATNWKTE